MEGWKNDIAKKMVCIAALGDEQLRKRPPMEDGLRGTWGNHHLGRRIRNFEWEEYVVES
jgi:hypothetical protein